MVLGASWSDLSDLRSLGAKSGCLHCPAWVSHTTDPFISQRKRQAWVPGGCPKGSRSSVPREMGSVPGQPFPEETSPHAPGLGTHSDN